MINEIFTQHLSNYDMAGLREDYGVLVLSHSRIELVKPMIRQIIYLLDQMEEDSIFTELQLWYMSLRHMILRIMKLDDFQRLHFNSMSLLVFYSVAQFLKYEIIERIDVPRTTEIFGDIGWKPIFPEYYQNKYLDGEEIDDLFFRRRHLYLLLNHAISYLEASGPIFDAILTKCAIHKLSRAG